VFCVNCGLGIAGSKYCSNCGTARAENTGVSEANTHGLAGDASAVNERKSLPKGVIALIALGAIGLSGLVLSISGFFENADIAECKRLVRESLKSPSSAKFITSQVEYSTAWDGDEGISVEGIVEAQNGFGATLQNKYWCSNFNTEYLEVEYITPK